MIKKTVLVAALIFSAGAPALVKASDDTPDWVMDTSGIGQSQNGYVRSEQLLELGTTDASGLQLEGETSLSRGDVTKALTALQRSVEMEPNDMDKRTQYASALESKLTAQKDKDPGLYNFVMKQWFFVYKNAEYIDQTLEAKAHLKHLSGSVPRPLEKADKYLARVLVPEDGHHVSVADGKKDRGSEPQ